ncbi:DUF411 domain-containing protein [Campylobacter geochelonis]|uniref:Copper amine oxidase N-terminal protein n=1 Tax=Campylobacter geochelonis TaxID=1780362 RepID=A0A128EB57_9BACT|nr:DUF411 domain-containing protein [Campylobacter geochelonis]QKF70380.1 DUF411 domain-containing protein [Campylobacter geochelonis]CZE46226.1 copper amine oxidase N-terminal protein [Campylobacter geochelonis]CZE46404.1 copper amine oxidase N-terminal protein [Campylobacter geochelonis]CZE50734.1 copper amine oxidase N-terminal protein [Campylobacter geochelonis]
MKKLLLLSTFLATQIFAASSVVMYKSPSCGCCDSWAQHLKDNGFSDIKTVKTNEMLEVKNKFKVPLELSSCHTAVIDDYIFEGHVPAVDVKEFLELKPTNAIGLTVAGMPLGSPGMEQGGIVEDYDVLMLKKDGTSEIFSSYMDGKRFK